MPTTRRWPTRAEWAEKIVVRIEASFPDMIGTKRAQLRADLIQWLGGSFIIERKIARLTEILKDGIETGKFGAIVPGSQGDDILQAFKDIYTLEILDAVDEEGNLK